MAEKKQNSSRREFLQKLTVFGTAGIVTPIVISACGGGDGGAGQGGTDEATAVNDANFSCTDTSGLTEQEIQMRENAEYVDATPNPDQYCANCELFEPPAGDAECGGCQVIQGPIHPDGYCTLWVAQQA